MLFIWLSFYFPHQLIGDTIGINPTNNEDKEEKINSIENDNHYKCTKTIIISNNLKTIEAYKFNSCKKLKSIIFSKDSTLTLIENHAFFGCLNLESIEIPKSL